MSIQRENHGMAKTRAYKVWENIVARCTNSRHPLFKYYGGRGISISPEWRRFMGFYSDMGDPPDGATIDRIDNDRGYEQGNCRWVSWAVQARNKRSNRYYEVDGKRRTVTDLATERGLVPCTVFNRLRRGMTIHEALR